MICVRSLCTIDGLWIKHMWYRLYALISSGTNSGVLCNYRLLCLPAVKVPFIMSILYLFCVLLFSISPVILMQFMRFFCTDLFIVCPNFTCRCSGMLLLSLYRIIFHLSLVLMPSFLLNECCDGYCWNDFYKTFADDDNYTIYG